MKIINKINNELIDIREYAKPNACFNLQINQYPDNYDFCIFHEQFNPFDLFNDNKIKDKEIERLNKGLEYIELYWSNREEYEKNNLLRQIRDKNTSIEWLEKAIEEEKKRERLH